MYVFWKEFNGISCSLTSSNWNAHAVAAVVVFRRSNEVTYHPIVYPRSSILWTFVCHNEVAWWSEWRLVEVKVTPNLIVGRFFGLI